MTVLQIVLLFFSATFLAVITLYMWYLAVSTSPRYELKKRMRSLALDTSDRRFPADLRLDILKEMTPVDRFFFRFKIIRLLDAQIDNAGLKTDVKMVLLLMFSFAALAYTIGLILAAGQLAPLILMPVAALLPLYYLHIKKARRTARFTEQFPDALYMVSRSLKAGHSLSAALQMVGQEMPDPMATLFRAAYEEQALGLSMREALEHMSRRVPSTDLRFFVMATNIHREMGGNLGEILERLAHTIRERLTIRRQVRVYTAQARLSGYVLAAMPLAMTAFFYFSMPGYIEELFTVKWGVYAIYLAILGQFTGFLVIKKIINIKI